MFVPSPLLFLLYPPFFLFPFPPYSSPSMISFSYPPPPSLLAPFLIFQRNSPGAALLFLFSRISFFVYNTSRSSLHTYIHTYIHSYIHTYIHTYIHSFIHSFNGIIDVNK